MSFDLAPELDLAPERLGPLLTTRRLGREHEALASCPSTNDRVAASARAGAPEGLLVVADSQSGGRGRQGRLWHSPPGENLYLSVLLRPGCAPAALPPLTLLAGAVLADVVAELGLLPLLKWPNDLLIDHAGGLRKVAGILTEMASDRDRIRHVVVGIGLNVNSTRFPDDLAGRASSLCLASGHKHDRTALLAAVLNRMEPAYDHLLAGGPAACLARWREHARLPRPCRVDREGERLEGIAVDVDAEGALLVRDGAGRLHRVLSGVIETD